MPSDKLTKQEILIKVNEIKQLICFLDNHVDDPEIDESINDLSASLDILKDSVILSKWKSE